jgi:hyperosmotically inducible protein
LADNQVKSTDISVETKQGEVMLSGFVDNEAQANRAVQVARAVDGVKSVNNKMSVKG